MKKLNLYILQYWEAAFWIAALILLAFMDPTAEHHFSLCVFKWMGFEHCPGCGLGHSISCLLRGNFSQSFAAHPLGFVAVIILLQRIYFIIKYRRVFLIP